MADQELEYLRVGVISNTHGIRGEVKVFPTTDDVKRFQSLKKVTLDTGREYLELEIQGVRFFKQMAILKFKGIDTINEIEKYKGKDLLVQRKDAVPLKENEYFIYDIIGAAVFLEDGTAFGKIKEVLATGANDVYVITRENGQEVLVPVIKECVLDINTIKKEVRIRLMKGLIEE